MENLLKSRRKNPKLKPIARKRHNFVYLLLAILLGILTVYIFINYPPTYKIPLWKIQIPIIPIFLATLSGFIFSTLTFIFIQKTQGIIISIFVIAYLILRLVGLNHWIFLVLFGALFITTELFIFKKK